MLLIADEQKGIALAGVMGGQNTEINDDDRGRAHRERLFLADEHPAHEQGARPAQRIVSYRFERGADIGICDWASQRAAQLILETAGGQLGGRRRGRLSETG